MSKRVVGIDYGQARIGVALSDPSQMIASPLTTLQNKRKLEEVVKEFLSILNDYSIEEIVIGMPFKLDGKIGTSAQEVLRFVEALKEQTTLPIKTWDERLTTQQTERVMKAGNVSRKKRMKVIDSACAALILQNYLDEKSMRLRE